MTNICHSLITKITSRTSLIIEKRKTATYEVLFDLALMQLIKHFFIPRVKAFFALTLLLANLHETEKTKTQKKKIMSQN